MYIPGLRRIPDVVKERGKADPESVITYALINRVNQVKEISRR